MQTDIIYVALASAAATGLVIVALVSVLVVVKDRLVPSGTRELVINDDEAHPLTSAAGSTLLSALAEHSIFLPSACGGTGTCALCRCQVLGGGGEVLPTERNHLSHQEVSAHWRLACQVKVREDMQLRLPEEVFGIQKWECEVVSNRNVATFIKEFIVRLPEGTHFDFKPGSYIQVDVPACEVEFKDIPVEEDYREDWTRYKMWDLKMVNTEPRFRAYSMANHPAEDQTIMLNIRISTPPFDAAANTWMDVNPGVSSSYMFSRRPGEHVFMSGPYGDFFIKDTDKEMVYIGGGAGMAPLRSHIFHLFMGLRTTRRVSYWYGGRSVRELFYTEEFRKIEKEFPNFEYHIALSDPLKEDRWEGPRGLIHQVLYERYLRTHPEPEEIEYYICGPPLMLKACLAMLDDLGVPTENIAFDDFSSDRIRGKKA